MGTAPAPGAADRRPRRLAPKRGESPDGELESTLAKVVGEGANHCARGGRAPLQLNGSGLGARLEESFAVSQAARGCENTIRHGMISNEAILSPSSLKKNRRSTGLPGKFPTRWLVTTVFPSFSSHAKGSFVYSYVAEASVFHSLIAARPLWVCPSSFTTALSVKHCETASPSPLSAAK